MRYLIFGFCWLALAFVMPAGAEEYDDFVGSYEGTFSGIIEGEERTRDLSVQIEKIDEGFNVSWATTTFKKGKEKSKEYSIDFLETDREHIYKAAQKKNLFGGRDPLDPMKGDPYFWARIEGRKLTVYAMIVTEAGGYEMQTFDRVLTDDNNLQLTFSRIKDGEVMKTITSTLVRTGS